jgi:hypothetical protein
MRDESSDVNSYDDIINLPHHVSKYHPPMSRLDRAAQFSSFTALTGFDNSIKETARLTNRKIALDETTKTILDEKLNILHEQLSSHPKIEITYFQPDKKKSGGEYVTVIGIVKKIDRYKRIVIMQDEIRIPIEDIIEISGEIFKSIEDSFV